MLNLCPAFGWESADSRVVSLNQIKSQDEYYKDRSISSLNSRYVNWFNGMGGIDNTTVKYFAYIPVAHIIAGLVRIIYSTYLYCQEYKKINLINKKDSLDVLDKHRLKVANRVKNACVEHIKRGIAECAFGTLLIIVDAVVTLWNDKLINNYCKENNIQRSDLKKGLLASGYNKPDSVEKIDQKKAAEMPQWKLFMRSELQKQLNAIGKTFNEAEENGDCFPDSVAQQLSKHEKYKSITKKDVRLAIADHLKKVNQDPYSQEAVQYKALLSDEAEYEALCNHVGKCLEDFKTGEGAPIWGNNAIAQMIANIYDVEVRIYASQMLTVTIADTLKGIKLEGEGGELKGGDYSQFNFMPIIDSEGLPAAEVCSLIETEEDTLIRYEPLEGTKKNGVIELANISRGPWGHWIPVVALES